ncbi:MAG TPA: sigma-54 dependent transcriptional regulator [Steroidobacteraceae bacterium]|nr:sigma-54 dependent transcriptional regulator [Steroidobacteraceae bacterium]
MTNKLMPATASLGFGISSRAQRPAESLAEPMAVSGHKPKILVVDEDSMTRRVMAARLGAASYAVQTVGSAQKALERCVLDRPNVVIADLHLAGMSGTAFLKELKSRWPLITVVVLTAHGTIREAVEATQCGAFSYLIKPIGREELAGQMQRAIAASTFNPSDSLWREKIISRSQLMEDRLAIANRAAGCDVPVLLTGENGTGKELLARAIHAASARRKRPFVVVDCNAAHRERLQAELFGDESRASAMQRARGGTLLVDRIDEMPLDLQATLASAIGQSSPAGPTSPRIICTARRDLGMLAEKREFCRDLLLQINVFSIEIPPLGRRREDIPLLVSHFLEQATGPTGKKRIYSSKAIELLATTDWPGNVRQLFELVKQHVALCDGKHISKEFVEQSLGPQAPAMPAFDEARDQFARDFLADNLHRAQGNVTKAARSAKRNRSDFYKLLNRYRLQVSDFKGDKAANR